MQNLSPIESYLNSIDLKWYDLIEYMPVGIMFFNDKWEIKSYNSNFIDFFSEELYNTHLEGLNLFTKNPLSSRLPLKEILSLKSGKHFEKEISVLYRNMRRNLLFKGSPIFIDGIFQGGTIIVEDYNFYKSDSAKYSKPDSSIIKFLDLFSNCYMVLDENANITKISENIPSKCEQFREMEGNNIAEIFKSETGSDFISIVNQVRENISSKSIDLSYYSESEKVEFNSVFLPLRDDNKIILLLREKRSSDDDIVSYLSNSSELREFESIAKAASDGFFKVNLHGTITFWTQNAAELFNIASPAVKSKFIGTIFPEFTQSYFETIRSIILSKGEWKGYLKSEHLESDSIVEVKIISKVHETVTDLFVFCNHLDKNDQKLLNAEKEEKIFFKDAVVKSNEMILQVNPAGTILFANDIFCQKFSIEMDELRGKQIIQYIDPAFRKEYNISDFEALINIKDIDFWHILKDNSEVIEVCFEINLSTEAEELKYFTIYLRECSKKDMLFLKTAHSLLYQFPEPIAIIHKNLIIKVNPEFCKLFGSEYETNFYKKPVEEIVTENSKEFLTGFLTDYSQNEEEMEISFRKSDSTEFNARISKIYSSSEYSFSVLLFNTLTKKEQTEINQSDQIKAQFHNIGPYFWTGYLKDDSIVLNFIDKEFLIKIGYKNEEINLNPEFWENIIHPDDINRFSREITDLKHINDGESKEINYRIINSNGDVVWISNRVKISVNEEKGTNTIYGSITDATDWLSEREELKSIIDELDKLNTAKEKFISIISHDLKSPFTSIVGFADLILTDSKLSKDDILGFVSHIKEASLHTVELLNSLVDLTKLQTGRIEVEPKVVNANFLVHKTVEILSGLAFQKGIELTSNVDKSIYITADDNLILQVFNNLVANSIKFTPKGGSINISAKEIRGEQKIEFTVEDTGVGIDEDDIDKLFVVDKKFTTLGTDGERGTGLGLSLVNEIIEKHKGKIRVESEVGKGSKFIFSLPISTPSILLLDGIESERILYSKLLQTITESIEIIPVDSENKALEIVQEKMPMLIIFEHDLPRMKGDDFIGELVKAELIYQPSLFVLTKSYSQELDDSYKEIGVNEVFKKPFELQKFKSKLDKYIGKIE